LWCSIPTRITCGSASRAWTNERYREAAAAVHVRSGTSGPDRIRVRFRDLSPVHQAGLLRLDPLADRAEYAELAALVEDGAIRSLEDLAE
jgi:hypothetical protein